MTYVGAFVFPEVMRGITEASITRSLRTPRTRSSSSTTASRSAPILQLPTGWKIVVAMSPEDMARSSQMVMGIYNALRRTAARLEDDVASVEREMKSAIS